jgi:predicted alpha/beta-hydrolase family hydrolase
MTSGPPAPLFVFAHGAGAGRDHPWMRRVADGLTRRGVIVVTFNFPYIEARRSAPDRGPVLEEAFQRAWHDATRQTTGRVFAGGKSMGGRIASQAAARQLFEPPAAGLVFFGYPLHPPGKANQRRDRHLPTIQCPMLFLQGTRDPFGSPDELRALVETLPRATLHLVEGGDHSLVATKRADPSGQSLERVLDLAAEFIGRQ